MIYCTFQYVYFISMKLRIPCWQRLYDNKWYPQTLTVFFSYRSYAVQFIYLKYTVGWLLVYSLSCTTLTVINFRTLLLLQKETVYPLAVTINSPIFPVILYNIFMKELGYCIFHLKKVGLLYILRCFLFPFFWDHLSINLCARKRTFIFLQRNAFLRDIGIIIITFGSFIH